MLLENDYLSISKLQSTEPVQCRLELYLCLRSALLVFTDYLSISQLQSLLAIDTEPRKSVVACVCRCVCVCERERERERGARDRVERRQRN